MLTFIVRALWCVVAVAAAACSPQPSEDPITAAQQKLAANDLAGATVLLKQELQRNPQGADMRYMLGKVLLDSGDARGAVVELEKALQAGYAIDAVAPTLAHALLQSAQPRRVIDDFTGRTLPSRRATAELKTVIALAHLAENQAERAQVALQSALGADPGYVPAQLLAAQQRAKAGELDAAIEQTRGVLATEPNRVEALTLLAEFLRTGKNDTGGATKLLEAALAAAPRHIDAHVALLAMALEGRELESARSRFAAMKQAAPTHPQTLFHEARIALLDNDVRRARQIGQQLVKLAPKNAQFVLVAAEADFRDGALLSAANLAGRATGLAPTVAGPRLLLAQIQLQQRDAAQALRTLEPLLGANPSVPSALGMAAEAAVLQGDLPRAEALFAQAAKVDPADTRLPVGLAMTQLLHAKPGAAVEIAFAKLEALAAADETTFADLALIQARLRVGATERALEAIARAEQKQPKDPTWATLRGHLSLAKREIPAARGSFESALKLAPVHLPALMPLIELDVADKMANVAIGRLHVALNAAPDHPVVRLALADVHRRQGARPEEVAAIIEEAVRRSPADPAPRIALVAHHMALGKHTVALSTAQSAATALPQDQEVLATLGRAQLAAGEPRQAVASFKQLVAAAPRHGAHLVSLAGAHLAANDASSARTRLLEALIIDPMSLPAHRGLMDVALADGQWPQALERARQVQTRAPKRPEGFEWEAAIQATQKRWLPAAEAYRQALQRSPTTDAAIRLHITLLAAGQQLEADRLTAEWLKKQPRSVALRLHLADRYLAQSDFAAAEAHYRVALEVSPQQASALNNLAWIMATQRRTGAAELAERANQLSPDDPLLMDTLALALAAEGAMPRALQVQSRAVEMAPQAAQLRMNLARIATQAGDHKLARTELTKLVALGERYAGQDEVSRLLKSLP